MLKKRNYILKFFVCEARRIATVYELWCYANKLAFLLLQEYHYISKLLKVHALIIWKQCLGSGWGGHCFLGENVT